MNASDRRFAVGALAVLAVYAAIQSVAVGAPWFPADDAQELAFVRTSGGFAGLLGVDAFGLFRPLKNLLFLAFLKLEPLGMTAVRAFAILIGMATFAPVLAFFRRVFVRRRLALVAAAIWLLSPTLVSSVVWLSCVNIQLMCGLVALALALHDRRRPLLASLTMLLACGAYELAVAVGPCAVAFDFFLRPRRLRERRTGLAYALYLAVTLGFLAVRNAAGSVGSVCGNFAGCTRGDVVFASAYLSCQHFLSWLWPFGRMAVFGGYAAGSVAPAVLAASWLVLSAVAVAAFVLRRRQPVIAFGLAVTLVGFLPVSNVTGLGNGPYGDYYLAIASMGLAAACAAACELPVGRLAVAILRGAAVIASFHFAWLWADGDRAYFASTANFPEFFGSRIFLATRLSEAGLWKEALALGEDVERLVGPDSGQMGEVYLVRGLYALLVEKDAERAFEMFGRSRKTDDFGGPPRNRDYYLGCVCEDLLDDPERAERFYLLSLRGRWGWDSVQAADRLARIRAERGDLDSAIRLWRRALAIRPDCDTVSHNLRLALKRSGYDEEPVR